jgi:hypothetical protein
LELPAISGHPDSTPLSQGRHVGDPAVKQRVGQSNPVARDPELKRILASVEGTLARVERTLARQEQAFERQERAFERQERMFAFQMETFEKLVVVTGRMIERLEDMGDQIRTNTQAVLRALDRLDGPRPSEGA